jgi:hypothetical protein
LNPSTPTDSKYRWFLKRVGKHIRWARQQGVGRLVEEDQLSPKDRLALARSKRRWRKQHDVAPGAIPVYVVGVQRSGTNMLVRGLERSPEFDVCNENDGRAFFRFRLRPDDDVRRLIESDGHRYILFKPLIDSHRIVHLLDGIETAGKARAIWAFRSVDGRVRSAVAKFGARNHTVLSDIKDGNADSHWEAQGLSQDSLDLISSFDYEKLSPESAAALFWYVRNRLFFEMDLHQRDDVRLVSYDAFTRDPETTMRSLCDFLGFTYSDELIAHVEQRSSSGKELQLDPAIRRRCQELQRSLEEVASTQAAPLLT